MILFKSRASKTSYVVSPAKKAGELSAACLTYLKEWYAGDEDSASSGQSKQINKGNYCELYAIDFIAEREGLGLAEKNQAHFDNSFMTGTPDVITDEYIYDAKCSWNRKTFLASVESEISDIYYWQLQSYMVLTGRKKAKVCFVLLDTPADVNYGIEISYSHLPIEERYYSIEVELQHDAYDIIKDKVIKCREWLKEYDESIKSKLYKQQLTKI